MITIRIEAVSCALTFLSPATSTSCVISAWNLLATGESRSHVELLTARIEDLADALQETSASIDRISITIRQNADNARSASNLSDIGIAVAQEGRDIVGQVLKAMRDIESFIHDGRSRRPISYSLGRGGALNTGNAAALTQFC